MKICCSIGLLCSLFIGTAVFAGQGQKPPHPSSIRFDTLNWHVPQGGEYRSVLSNGMRAFIAEDHKLPIVTISAWIKTGSISDPTGKEGLATLTTRLMRTGGTKRYRADSLDAILEQYAIHCNLALRPTELEVNCSVLSEYLDKALDILEQILFEPAFEPSRFSREKTIAIEEVHNRFDDPNAILEAAFSKAMYGNQSPARLATKKSLSAITRNDCETFHDRTTSPKNIVLSASGDFDRGRFISRLETFGVKTSSPIDTAFPNVKINPTTRCLIVHRPGPQTNVALGLPLFMRPDPDYYPMSAINLVLGGSGFNSRLGTAIRSDAGLTYSIYSTAGSNYFFPATLGIKFHSKNESALKALAMTLDQVKLIIDKGVTEKELDFSRKILIESLPSMFRSADDLVQNYAWSEYAGRTIDHFVNYPGEIKKLTIAKLDSVAHKYLTPDSFTYVIVGDTAALFASDTSINFSLKKLSPKVISIDSLNVLWAQ